MAKRFLFLLMTLLSTSALSGQDGVYFSFVPGAKFRVIERSDYRLKVNGVYKGHIYNENRGILEASREKDGSYDVSGNYYVFEQLTHDGSRSFRKVDEINRTGYRLYSSGEMILDRGETYPLLRSFPNFCDKAIPVGGSWLAFSEKVVIRDDTVTVFPVYCEYVYDGPGTYNGEAVLKIHAKYAVRYKQGDDPGGDPELKNISGTHEVAIILSADTGEPVLYRDNMRELHSYADGGSLEKTGFILTFFKGVRGLDRAQTAQSLVDDLKRNLGDDALDNVAVDETDEGVVLTLKQLHFLPDRAVLLAQDVPLLDTIASYLKTIEGRTFLVKGHTADVGSSESQFSLSVARAEVVVKELIKRGVPQDRLIYMGLGGTEPLESNDTEEGRAANRRVELVIMED